MSEHMVCKYGHSMADAYVARNGSHCCRICRRESHQREKARKKAGLPAQRHGDTRPDLIKAKATTGVRVAQLVETIAWEKNKPHPNEAVLTLYRRGLLMELWRGRTV